MAASTPPDAVGHRPETQPHKEQVKVSVYTTSGSYPRHGFDPEPVTALVSAILAKAARALNLTDTTNWVATVDGRDIEATKSYRDNHLSGHVKIQWGPREGGGGSY